MNMHGRGLRGELWDGSSVPEGMADESGDRDKLHTLMMPRKASGPLTGLSTLRKEDESSTERIAEAGGENYYPGALILALENTKQ